MGSERKSDYGIRQYGFILEGEPSQPFSWTVGGRCRQPALWAEAVSPHDPAQRIALRCKRRVHYNVFRGTGLIFTQLQTIHRCPYLRHGSMQHLQQLQFVPNLQFC